MRRSFRSALIIFIVAAAVLPVLMVSVPFVFRIHAMTREGAVKELGLSAERVAADIQHELDFIYSRFVSIGRDKDMVLAVTSPFFGFRAITLSTNFLNASPVVHSTYLLDARLELLEALPEASAAPDISRVTRVLRKQLLDPARYRERAVWLVIDDAVLMQQLGKGKPAAPDSDNRFLVLAMPLYFEHYVQDRANVMQGMLVALIPLRDLTQMAREHLQPYQDISVLSRDAAARRDAQDSVGRETARSRLLIKEALPGPLHLAVGVSEPDAVRFRGVHLTLLLLSLFVLAVTALFSILAFMLARRLGQPLDGIRQLAHEYASGNYQPPIHDIDFEEFQQISLALAMMGRRIETHLEELRTTNEQLLQADRLKDDFLANTSHELRTPLHGIIGIATSLSDGAAGELSPRVQKNLMLIEQSGRRLENLVNDILDISRIKNNALRLDLKPVEIFSLVDVVLSLHAAQAERLGLSLVNDVPRTLPLVEADEFRLQQVLHNLVGNALKFSGQGEVVVAAAREQDSVRISVTDSGLGIPPEKLKSIFEPFVQIESALTRSHSGSGLGLAISRQLVELHHGHMEVASNPGRGSTFSFTLPIAADQSADTLVQISAFQGFDSDFERGFHETEPLDHGLEWGDRGLSPAGPGALRARAHVLVVDDENINIQILTNYFFDEPYVLHIARSGPEALELLERIEQIDMILLDVMMPKMSGYEVCCRIRTMPRFEHVPILFLTARNQAKDIHHGFYYGCNDYLVKPVSRVELLTRCQYHLQYARLKTDLSRLNGALEKEVELRTRTLQEAVQEERQTSRALRALLTVGLQLQQRTPLQQRLQASLDAMANTFPEQGFAVVLGEDIHCRLPLPVQSDLHLAVHAGLDWRSDAWLVEHDLQLLPLGGAQSEAFAGLLLWPAARQARTGEIAALFARQLGLAIEYRRLAGQLERHTIHDALTGVCNRHFFEQAFAALNHSFARYPDRHFCLVVVGIDRLQAVKDIFGQAAADAIIVETARMLNQGLRQSDVLCRIQDDCFAIIVEASSYLNCTVLCERLRHAQRDARLDFDNGNGVILRLPMGFSVGMASTEHMTPEALWLCAEQAMLQSRRRSTEAEDTQTVSGRAV